MHSGSQCSCAASAALALGKGEKGAAIPGKTALGRRAAREELERRGRARLDELVGRLEASRGAVEGAHFRVGSPAAEIVAQAEELGVGLVVLGSRGLGATRRALTGSVSERVVSHAHCAVMIIRG